MTFALPGILLAAVLAQQTSDATSADRKACAALADLATPPWSIRESVFVDPPFTTPTRHIAVKAT
jgi:hypothetical protein